MGKTWKDRIRFLATSYAAVPYLIAVAMNFAVYYVARPIYKLEEALGILRFHDLTIPQIDGYFEDNLLAFRWFVVIYCVYFVCWLGGYWIIAGEEKKVSHPFFAAAIIGMTTCLLVFVFYPTAIAQPVVGDNDNASWNFLARIIYQADEPNNLFPSIHCMNSYFVARGTWKCRNLPKGYKWFCLFACIAVFASTLFIRQHLFVDLIGAVVVAEASILLERATRAGRLFDKLDRIIRKETPV